MAIRTVSLALSYLLRDDAQSVRSDRTVLVGAAAPQASGLVSEAGILKVDSLAGGETMVSGKRVTFLQVNDQPTKAGQRGFFAKTDTGRHILLGTG